MTQRERQILQWIEADPMISQEALAERAGITRSSVAVHISNLMKKGYIAGKGYVLRSGTYAAVVGGVNVDIGGQSYAPLVARDSNPGRVRISLGGVGRNIAHNMSLLGVDVRLLTAFGDDLHAQRVAASCGELGIDISHALQVPGGTTSTYLFLNDVDGDMALGLSDMDICERITPAYLASNLSLLNNAQVIVADTNIPAESLQYLVTHCTPPVFVDPVSTAKARKVQPVLGRVHTLKPNRIEAELLSGDHGRSQPAPCGFQTARDRPAPRVHLPWHAGRVRRRPEGNADAALHPRADAQRHRCRRCLHGRAGLGLSRGHGTGRNGARRRGSRRYRHRGRRNHQPCHVCRRSPQPHGRNIIL